jgi:hypothetical protein
MLRPQITIIKLCIFDINLYSFHYLEIDYSWHFIVPRGRWSDSQRLIFITISINTNDDSWLITSWLLLIAIRLNDENKIIEVPILHFNRWPSESIMLCCLSSYHTFEVQGFHSNFTLNRFSMFPTITLYRALFILYFRCIGSRQNRCSWGLRRKGPSIFTTPPVKPLIALPEVFRLYE